MDLDALKQELAEEAVRVASRGWYAEGQRIARSMATSGGGAC